MRNTWRTQQTPKPAAQLPWATPPYWAHSVLKSIFWFWLTVYNHVNHKMLLKNPRVTLMSTWCSMCHCPLCLPRTLHCQTSPRWSGSGTWNIQFYQLKILTKIWVALSAITWGPPALALQGSERQGSKAGESLRPPNQLLPSCWRKSNHIFITATNPDQWSMTTSSYVSILCWELHIHI